MISYNATLGNALGLRCDCVNAVLVLVCFSTVLCVCVCVCVSVCMCVLCLSGSACL